MTRHLTVSASLAACVFLACLSSPTTGQFYGDYLPAEGYPSWVQLPPVDPNTLTPNKVVEVGGNVRAVVEGAAPGDVIMLRNGTHIPDNFIQFPTGTRAAPITIMAETPGQAVITRGAGQHFGVPLRPGSGRSGLHTDHRPGVRWRG